MSECIQPNCDRAADRGRLGWCKTHYTRSRRGTDMDRPMRPLGAVADRCSVPGCDNPNPCFVYKDFVSPDPYCTTHIRRLALYGDVNATKNPRFLPYFHMVDEEKVAKIMARLTVDPEAGCWNTQTKYPRARVDLGHDGTRQVRSYAYIIMWSWANKRPATATIDHLCCNPRCANPAHLEMVSDRENVRRHHARTASA